jgi:DNA-directed RNA polymerase beta' subunit
MSPQETRMTPHGSTPVPDPTVLTTEQLLREIEAVKELFEQRIEAVEKGIAIAHENITRVPTEVDKAIVHLRELSEERLNTIAERFEGVKTQFTERDTRVEQTRVSAKEALDAALQAAKEAVGKQNDSFVTSIAKSEAATNKQIEQLGQLINTMTSANGAKVDDLKDRVLRLEGARVAVHEATSDKRATTSTTISTVGLVIALVLALSAVGSLLLRFTGH